MKKIIEVPAKRGTINIGQQDDNNAYEYAFNISDFYENFGSGGVFAIRISRPTPASPEKGAPYYASVGNYHIDGDVLYWSPDETDTQYNGQGGLQIEYTLDEQRALKKTYITLINQSLNPVSDPPEVWETYLKQIGDAFVSAEEMLKRIEGEIDALNYIAEGYAVGTQDGEPVSSTSPYWHNNALYYADMAGQSAANAGFIDMEINNEGRLIYYRSDVIDIDFALDDGHLILEVI